MGAFCAHELLVCVQVLQASVAITVAVLLLKHPGLQSPQGRLDITVVPGDVVPSAGTH